MSQYARLEEKVFENAVRLSSRCTAPYVTFVAEKRTVPASDDQELLEKAEDVVNVKRSVEVPLEALAL